VTPLPVRVGDGRDGRLGAVQDDIVLLVPRWEPFARQPDPAGRRRRFERRKRGQQLTLMYRTSGVGLTSFGIVLVVIGAIMRFAVTVHTSGFNIHKVGDIFLLVGVLLVILSIVIIAMGSRSRSTIRTDVRATPSGQQRTEQRDDWGGP
jgi:uncharacterized membrane protein YidH (DUF202 family)